MFRKDTSGSIILIAVFVVIHTEYNMSTNDCVVPTISLASSQESISAALSAACTKVGFFYLVGHGISQHLMDEVIQQSQTLFALPVEQKKLLSDQILNRGYTAFEEETLDPANQPTRGDTKEGYYIGDEAPPEETDASKLHGPNVWPNPTHTNLTLDECSVFRGTMERYQSEAIRVCKELLHHFALAAGSNEPEVFDAHFSEAKTFIRLLRYSTEQSDEKSGLFACGAHSDYGMMTLLLTDDNPGLQVKNVDGSWVDVPPKRGAFVVNVGDMFERWTNRHFKSTLHRVMTPMGARERYSVPFFFEPNFDALVKCLDCCCSEDNPPKYPPITAGQHLLNMYEKTHADFEYTSDEK